MSGCLDNNRRFVVAANGNTFLEIASASGDVTIARRLLLGQSMMDVENAVSTVESRSTQTAATVDAQAMQIQMLEAKVALLEMKVAELESKPSVSVTMTAATQKLVASFFFFFFLCSLGSGFGQNGATVTCPAGTVVVNCANVPPSANGGWTYTATATSATACKCTTHVNNSFQLTLAASCRAT